MEQTVETMESITIPLEDFPHVDENSTLRDAVATLRKYTCGSGENLQFSELMVLNRRKTVVGKLTIFSIFAALEPRLMGNTSGKFEGHSPELSDLSLLYEESFGRSCSARMGTPIREIMASVPATLKSNDPLLKALYYMSRHRERSLPVMQGGKTVGIVRLQEVFAAACKACGV